MTELNRLRGKTDLQSRQTRQRLDLIPACIPQQRLDKNHYIPLSNGHRLLA